MNNKYQANLVSGEVVLSDDNTKLILIPELLESNLEKVENYYIDRRLIEVRKGNKYGFIDLNGKKIVSFKYDYVSEFKNGLCLVKKNGLFGYINQIGQEVIPCNYVDAMDFSFDKAVVAKFDKNNNIVYGYIDTKGNVVIPFIYESAASFKNGLACVKRNGKFGYIDENGRKVINYKFDHASDFSEGLAFVKETNSIKTLIKKIKLAKNNSLFQLKEDDLSDKFYIDILGKKVIECSYDNSREFHDGLAKIDDEEENGFIDKNGRLVISCKYQKFTDFSEGLAVIFDGKKYGYVDCEGKVVIPCQYDNAYNFKDGMAVVCSNKKYGYINNKGKLVIPFQYDMAQNFHDGLAIVIKDGHGMCINQNGAIKLTLNQSDFFVINISSKFEITERLKEEINSRKSLIINLTNMTDFPLVYDLADDKAVTIKSIDEFGKVKKHDKL